MATVDRPEIRLGARDETRAAFDSVKKNLAGLKLTSEGLSSSMRGIFAVAGVGLFTKFVAGGVQATAALDDLSEKTSLSVETISQLQRVAIIGGHSLDSVAQGASKFARSVAEAVGGNEALLKSFEAVGISQKELKEQRVDELYVKFASNIANAENATNALAQAVKLAGKSAAEQIPFYRDLASEGLKGATVTAKQAQSAEDLQKAIKRLTLEFDILVKLPVAKAIIDISDALGVATTKAITLGDRLKLAFSGDVNIGRFAELAKREAEILKEIEDVPGRSLGQRLLQGPDAGRLKALQDELTFIRAQKDETGRLIQIRDELNAKPAEQDKINIPPPEDEGAIKAAREAQKALLAFNDAKGKALVEQEKTLADTRLAILDRFYKQGLIAEEEYWTTREEVQKQAINAAIADTEREIKARRAAVGQAAADLKKAKAGRVEDPAEQGEAVSKATVDLTNAQKDLFEVENKRKVLQIELANVSQKTFLDAADSAKEYKDAVEDLAIEMDRLRGNTERAAAVAFDRQTETLRNRAESAKDTGTTQLITDLRNATIAQARFNDVRARNAEQVESLALAEERIQNSLRVGAISELEALRRTSDARQQAIGQLEEFSKALDTIAAGSKLKALELQAEAVRNQLEQLKNESDLVAQKFNTIFETGLTDFFGDIASGAKTAKEAFNDMVKSIVNDITRLAAQDVARKLFGGTGGGGGLGGILAGLFKGGAGGGGGSGSLDIGKLIAMGMGSAQTGMSFVPRDMPVFVHKGEAIVPAGQNRGGGLSVVVNNYGGGSDRRSSEQQAAAVGEAVNRAMRRNR